MDRPPKPTSRLFRNVTASQYDNAWRLLVRLRCRYPNYRDDDLLMYALAKGLRLVLTPLHRVARGAEGAAQRTGALMITRLKGELEIDHRRGVVYFHLGDGSEIARRGVHTVLRISGLPSPIPAIEGRMLDIGRRMNDVQHPMQPLPEMVCDWGEGTVLPRPSEE